MTDLERIAEIRRKWEDIEGNLEMDPPVNELCDIAERQARRLKDVAPMLELYVDNNNCLNVPYGETLKCGGCLWCCARAWLEAGHADL